MPDHHAASEPDHAERRAELRRRRRALSAEAQHRAARGAADALAHWAPWSDATRIGVYVAVGGELDPRPAADDARSRGATIYVPVLQGELLRFAALDHATECRPNRYGIGEPVGVEAIDVGELDLVLVPAVAVDRRGNRIGMGAGWYDRTLAATARRTEGGPLLVAYVHAFQVVDQIRPRPWDVPVDVTVTPEGVTPTR